VGTTCYLGVFMANSMFPKALTFDDILLQPGYSKVLPTETITKTVFTKKILLNIPLVSAAMDTVTEAPTAIAIAQNGGIGIIHKNLSIEDQAIEVAKVKRSETGIIVDPICLDPNDNLAKAFAIKKSHQISGFPVTENGKLVGILTNRDLRFITNKKLKVREVMTKEGLVTVKENVTIPQAKKLLHKHRIEKLLVVDTRNNLKGMISVRDIEKKEEFPNAAQDKRSRLVVGAATSVGKEGLERALALHEAGADVIVVDSAHGHSQMIIDIVKKLKQKVKTIQIVAGNIATADAARDLIRAGADALKVGIGPGSICTTRVVSGVGVPQVYALGSCCEVAKKAGIPVIADGGVKFSGDIVKAIALGASTVMIGSLFAGTDESPGETILYQGRSYKVYRGMGSIGAMRAGSKDRYFQGDVQEAKKLVPEGIEGRVPYRGPLADSLYQLVGGLKSGMGYVGAKTIKDLQQKARFVQITAAGLKESHVHDVIITKEAPNYSFD